MKKKINQIFFNSFDLQRFISLIKKRVPVLLLIIAMQMLAMNSFSQNNETDLLIKGKVTEASGLELPGVTVTVPGTTIGTVTGTDGTYSFNVPGQTEKLVFSSIGFQAQEVEINGRTVVDIVMFETNIELDEIVAIGYGQVKKTDLTGSVSTLGDKDFNQGVTSSPQQLMLGRVAGVTITSNSGEPGAGSTIRIRGGSSLGGATNDPLIVIDGFPVDDGGIRGMANPLSTINPNDIESFTILKDASAAAIYGSRASNGVIIITTKKGGKKLKVTFNSDATFSTPIKFVDVLNGDEYRDLINSRVADGKPGMNEKIASRMGDENTDWQNEIYRNGISTNNNISVSGSIMNVPIRASYGYTTQQGVINTSEIGRHSLALNVTPSLFDDHLKIDLNAKATISNNSFGAAGQAVGNSVSFDPTQPVYNGNERYNGYFQWTEQKLPDGSMDPEGVATSFTDNPVAMLDLRDNVSKVNRFIGNAHLEYKLHFLPDLKAHVNVGIDKTTSAGHNNWLPGSTFTIRDYNDSFGSKSNFTGNYSSELLDAYLNYTKEIGESSINFTAGYSWQHWRRGATTYNRNWAEDYVVFDDRYYVSETDSFATDNPSENFLISTYGRLIYTLKDKYIVTATIRQDGSSRFRNENKFGLFPSMALAWKISEEDFLKGNSFISNLKMRAGYGVTGQQGLDPNNGDVKDAYYPAIAKYGLGQGFSYYPIGENGALIRIARPEPYDANLKWEETSTTNIGIDFGLWDNKLTGTVDLYDRETKDLLNLIPVADGSNFGNYILTNVGTMDIKGYEIELVYRPISTNTVSWSIGANLSYNDREITKLYNTENPSDPGVDTGDWLSNGLGTQVQIHTVGQEPSAFYVFQQVYDENGKSIEGTYVDRSGEGGDIATNQFNKYHYHSPNADYLIGINSRLSVKNWDFAFSGRISLGNYVYNNGANQALSDLYSNNIFFNNIRRQALDIGFEQSQPWSDIYVQNASFFKMDNISLGYTFENIVNEISPRLALTVQNAFTITKYKGIDPEVRGGIDNNMYPRARSFMLSLNVNF